MTDVDLWNAIESVAEIVGITDGNFDVMKSRGRLPDHWVTPVYLALKKKRKKISLERVYALAKTETIN